uniref:RING-type E3 ubiquitin transferase n=1 Tax=Davidia involucrata TaxID=16924 RepID=A0A5B7BTL4_DAVIN
MTSTVGHTFSTWQENEIIPSHLREQYEGFFIEIRVCNTLEQPNNNLSIQNSFRRSFGITRQQFLDKEDLEILLFAHLYNAYLPEDIEQAVINQVFNFGSSMMSDAGNADRKVLPIVVDVRIRTLQQPDEDENEDEAIDRANRESMEVSAFRPVPATQSSIQALEKMTLLDDSCSLKECAICLEMLSVGLEFIRMPCSHIYHGDCIVRWLERSNLCPLCRFAMPC